MPSIGPQELRRRCAALPVSKRCVLIHTMCYRVVSSSSAFHPDQWYGFTWKSTTLKLETKMRRNHSTYSVAWAGGDSMLCPGGQESRLKHAAHHGGHRSRWGQYVHTATYFHFFAETLLLSQCGLLPRLTSEHREFWTRRSRQCFSWRTGRSAGRQRESELCTHTEG